MDAVMERTNALKRMPLLADLPHGELEAIARRLTVEHYEEGQIIIKQGSSDSSAYFVLAGSCEVRRGRKNAMRRVAFLKPGDCFGELAIIVPAPRSATVTAFEPTDVLVLSGSEFRSALKANRSMALHLVRALAERLQKMEDEFTA